MTRRLALSARSDTQTAAGSDHIGALIVNLVRDLVDSGRWKRKHQGDGTSTYSSGTSDIFTGNGGLGYATSGTWTAGGGANTFTKVSAYIVIAELDAFNIETGRYVLFQRSNSTSAGQDRNLRICVAWAA